MHVHQGVNMFSPHLMKLILSPDVALPCCSQTEISIKIEFIKLKQSVGCEILKIYIQFLHSKLLKCHLGIYKTIILHKIFQLESSFLIYAIKAQFRKLD